MVAFPLRKGSQGPEVKLLSEVAVRRFESYAKEFDGSALKADGYFGLGEESFVRNWQGRSKLPVTGQLTEAQYQAIVGKGTASSGGGTVVTGRRKIWIYTFPGSGANWDQGPSFQLGERCRNVLNLNHQPVYFQKGGYLGFMGGAADFSYNEVTFDLYKSLGALLDANPDAQEALRLARDLVARAYPGRDESALTDLELQSIATALEFEHHLSGFSQSAQGVEEAAELLYGDGGFVHPGDPTQTPSGPGRYRLLRHTLKLVVQFGNPSTEGTGIARRVRSAWLRAKVRNVNYDNDFYAVVPKSDAIRPAMYEIIVDAQMEFPFFVRVLRLGARIIPEWLNLFGGLLGPFSPLAQLTVAGLAGLNAGMPLLGTFFGMAGTARDRDVDEQVYQLLKPTGVLANITGLIGLVGALPGLQAHGGYEFDPVMMDRAYAHIASFRR